MGIFVGDDAHVVPRIKQKHLRINKNIDVLTKTFAY